MKSPELTQENTPAYDYLSWKSFDWDKYLYFEIDETKKGCVLEKWSEKWRLG
jgi:hypothetical protein